MFGWTLCRGQRAPPPYPSMRRRCPPAVDTSNQMPAVFIVWNPVLTLRARIGTLDPMTYKQHPTRPELVIGDDGSVYRELRPHGVMTYSPRGKPSKHVLVHHLVLETFLGPRPAGQVGHHIDGDIHNNHAENLTWLSNAEHLRIHIARLTPAQVREVVRLREANLSTTEISRQLGIERHSVNDILRGQSWHDITGIQKRSIAREGVTRSLTRRGE